MGEKKEEKKEEACKKEPEYSGMPPRDYEAPVKEASRYLEMAKKHEANMKASLDKATAEALKAAIPFESDQLAFTDPFAAAAGQASKKIADKIMMDYKVRHEDAKKWTKFLQDKLEKVQIEAKIKKSADQKFEDK